MMLNSTGLISWAREIQKDWWFDFDQSAYWKNEEWNRVFVHTKQKNIHLKLGTACCSTKALNMFLLGLSESFTDRQLFSVCFQSILKTLKSGSLRLASFNQMYSTGWYIIGPTQQRMWKKHLWVIACQNKLHVLSLSLIKQIKSP
jgi:hypothetical protein